MGGGPEGRRDQPEAGHDLRLVLITGLSGAGKTEASRALEDVGFYVVDNLPPALIPTFAELCAQSARVDRAALVVDVRGQEFFDDLAGGLAALDRRGVRYQILFLEADDATLIRRYQASRRRHPLTPPGGRLADGIGAERRRLAPLRARADWILDTSALRPAELRGRVQTLFSQDRLPQLAVTLLSFGFRHGIPPDADLVLDVRFLPNPYYDPELRPLSGRDPRVAGRVLQAPATRRFLELLLPLLEFLLPQYAQEGRRQLVVALGCTGGRHRSVAVAEALAARLARLGYTVDTLHRDCDLAVEEEGGEPSSGEGAPGGP
jgi:UPF0042 nucleotide-binding protein